MIRQDIWSVKEWDSAIEPASFVHTRMFRSSHSVFRYMRGEGRGREMKVVHPADWVVDSYLALGNEVYD